MALHGTHAVVESLDFRCCIARGRWAMRIRTILQFLASVLVLIAGAPAWSAGGGGMQSSGTGNFDMPQRARTPEDAARESYNSGIRHLKDAKEYDDEVAKATDPKKVAKSTEKAQKAYQKGLKEFTNSVTKMPTMYEAWNYVGFTQRHLGDYRASLDAYAKAL